MHRFVDHDMAMLLWGGSVGHSIHYHISVHDSNTSLPELCSGNDIMGDMDQPEDGETLNFLDKYVEEEDDAEQTKDVNLSNDEYGSA